MQHLEVSKLQQLKMLNGPEADAEAAHQLLVANSNFCLLSDTPFQTKGRSAPMSMENE